MEGEIGQIGVFFVLRCRVADILLVVWFSIRTGKKQIVIFVIFTPLKSVTLWDGVVVHQPEQWLVVIDATYNSMDALQRRAVRMRYTGESYTKISDTLHISRNVYYAILDDARKFAVAAACQYRLVKIL